MWTGTPLSSRRDAGIPRRWWNLKSTKPSASARLRGFADRIYAARCWHLEASVRHWQRLAAAKLRRVVVAWRVTVVDRRPRPCVGPAWNGVALVGTIDADVVMLLGEGHRGCRQRRQNSCSGEN